MKNIFVTSSAFVALNNKKDKNHKNAVLFVTQLFDQTVKVYTSMYDVISAATSIHQKLGKKKTLEFMSLVLEEGGIIVLDITKSDFLTANKEYMKKSNDRNIDLHVFVTREVLKSHGIKDIFSFNRSYKSINAFVWPK